MDLMMIFAQDKSLFPVIKLMACVEPKQYTDQLLLEETTLSITKNQPNNINFNN